MSKLNWSQAVVACQQRNQAYALISLLKVKGSSPRDQGAKMVVATDAIWDSIGGGRLEHDMVLYTRTLLSDPQPFHEIKDYTLGTDNGQCCGGKVTVLIEVFPAEPFVLAVFGAGHIAQRLMPLVDEMPGKKYWVDQRNDWVHRLDLAQTEIIDDVDPLDFVECLPKGFSALVFTHSHALDFLLVEAMLSRGDAHFVGLIASKSKVARFKSALRDEGLSEMQIKKLTAPVGLSAIPGKLPVEVAVSIAGQLIQIRHHLIAQQQSVNTIDERRRGIHLVKASGQ